MATTKIWAVKYRFDSAINYIVDSNKTENKNNINMQKELKQLIDYAEEDYKTEKKLFVTGINCSMKTAVEEMLITKKEFEKEKGILAFHAVQSFNENEVTPELAHKIGVELAQELWGDRFQVVVSTHQNTNHLHNHFVINSVSYRDGKKYYDNHENYALMRHISDELCKKYRLSVLEEKPTKNTNINYNNFYKKKIGEIFTSYEETTKEDIDYAITQSSNYNEFESILKSMGYNVIHRSRKLSLNRYPYKRNIRIERRYGEEYSIMNIEQRIANNKGKKIPFPEVNSNNYKYRRKKYYSRNNIKKLQYSGSIYRLYLYYKFLLTKYKKYPTKQKISQDMREEIEKMEEISNETKFLCKKKIKSTQELIDYKEKIVNKKNSISKDIKSIKAKIYYNKESLNKNEISNKLNLLAEEKRLMKSEEVMCNKILERIPKIMFNIREEDKETEERKEKNNEKWR